MLYKNRKPKTEISISKAKEVLLDNDFKCTNIYPGSLSYTNDVFIFEGNDQDYVLKFFTDQWIDSDAGVREYDVLKKLEKEGFPVPKVVLFKRADESCPRNFMIMEKLEGLPLYKDFNNITKETIKDSIEILRKLSKIEGKFGFYGHDNKIHKTYDNHFDFINDGTFYAIKKMKDLGFNVDGLKEAMEKQKKLDPGKEKFNFTHCDFTPKHIFVKDGKITGLIDFEWTIFSEPINDAVLFLTSLSEHDIPVEYVKEVFDYCKSISTDEKFAYYCGRIYIGKASWPHKNVEQPYYSTTCLEKAKKILNNGVVELNDVLWSKSLGEIGE